MKFEKMMNRQTIKKRLTLNETFFFPEKWRIYEKIKICFNEMMIILMKCEENDKFTEILETSECWLANLFFVKCK